MLGEQAFGQCKAIDENARICYDLNSLKSDRVNGCVWDTLTYQNNSVSCEFSITKLDEEFVKFENNRYIYAVAGPRVVTATCDQSIIPIKLGGEGLLSLRDDCSLDSGNHILLPKKQRVNKIELHPWTSNLVGNMDEAVQPTVVKTLRTFEETDFRQLENELSKIKDDRLVINTHNIHHYTLIYAILILSVTAVVYFKWKAGTAQAPTPAPRRAISMPTLSRVGEC